MAGRRRAQTLLVLLAVKPPHAKTAPLTAAELAIRMRHLPKKEKSDLDAPSTPIAEPLIFTVTRDAVALAEREARLRGEVIAQPPEEPSAVAGSQGKSTVTRETREGNAVGVPGREDGGTARSDAGLRRTRRKKR